MRFETIFFRFFGSSERMRRSRAACPEPAAGGRGRKFVRAIFRIHRQSGFGKLSFASRLAAARRSAANLYSFLAEKENWRLNNKRKFFKTMRYIIYARKSSESEERQVLSIESQLAELREFAAKEKLEIVVSLCEAQTAKEPGRTKFAEMLSDIESGKAEGILSWHPDRLARNSVDGGRIIYSLDTGKIKDLKFPTFWFDNTPQGKFMLNIAFGQSKYYIDNLAENIKRGHRAKLRKGIWPGFAPLGYINNHRTKDIDLDEEKAPFIKKAFELYSTGKYTLKQIAKILKDLGLRSYKGNLLSVSCVQRLLKNPFYYGVFTFNNEMYQRSHKSIISKKLFDKCREVMAARAHKMERKVQHFFPFRGLMICGECGGAITAETQKGHNYYRCTKKKGVCSQKYIREETLTEQFVSFFQKVSLSSHDMQKVLKELEKDEQKAREEMVVFVQSLKEELKDIDLKLEKLLSAYLDEIILAEEYTGQKQKLLTRKVELREKIRDFEERGVSWLEPARGFIQNLNYAQKLVLSQNKSEMTTFLKNIGSNHILLNQQFSFSAKNEYKLAAERRAAARREAKESLKNPDWRGRQDSNLEPFFWREEVYH